MKYCVSCAWDLTNVELESNNCPKCERELTDIKSPKLAELMSELTLATYSIASGKLAENPKQIVEVAKTIEKGERQLQREYKKRIESMKEIEDELLTIMNFGDKMGYKLEG